MIDIETLEKAQSDFDDMQDKYLREQGWEHKCDNPANIWFWQKTLADGRTLMMNKDTALFFEGMSA